jgi:hypothetical protein
MSLWEAPASDSVRRLLKVARCMSRTSDCTTSDMGGRNSGSGCNQMPHGRCIRSERLWST